MNDAETFLLPLFVTMLSAVLAFIFSIVQKRIEFNNTRRSVAIALFVEIAHAKESAATFRRDWDEFREHVKDRDYRPLLVVSKDTDVLKRVHMEDFNYPQEIIHATTNFYGLIKDFYACLDSINSESFNLASIGTRVHIVDLVISIGDEVVTSADAAINEYTAKFPSAWFFEK